jgi:ATP-dependent DNA helicase RecG
LKLISDELKEYPEIDFKWREVGLSFQVQFIKLNFVTEQEEKAHLGHTWGTLGAEFGAEFEKPTIFSQILIHLQEKELNRKEITFVIGIEKISGYFNRTIKKLLSKNLIERTIPGIPNHPAQKFRITYRGTKFLELLKR